MLFGSVHAQTSYDNVDATFSWLIGNEEQPTITGDVLDAVKTVKRKVGTGLTQSKGDYSKNISAGTLAEYLSPSKLGNVPEAMVEYTIKMAKGTTFTLTSVEYDAVKNGTDDASYSWSYTVDSKESSITEVSKDKILRNDGSNKTTTQLRHTESITASGGQVVTVRFYISGFKNKKCAIGNLNIKGKVSGTPVVRSFKDFKVDFRFKVSDDQQYIVIQPTTGELPTGVQFSNVKFNDAQHGAKSATMVIPVDGPVKFTIGSCQYGNHTVTVTDVNGGDPVAVDNNNGCESTPASIDKATYEKYVVYTYNNETPTTLTFTLNGYMPFFFAEACDYVESCDVVYYDTDGKKAIGTETVDGGSELKYKYGVSDVTVPTGYTFRGWFNGKGKTATKVAEGTAIDADIALYAKATEVEIPALGKVFKYDMTKTYFYIEDHDAISVNGGHYHNTHGFIFQNGNSFSVDVAGKAQIIIGLCQHSTDAPITVTDANDKAVGTIASAKAATDGTATSFKYDGEATKLTFTFGGTTYIHNVAVYNVSSFVEKDAESGYYIIPANDGASLTLVMASAGASTETNPLKIFLPNGTYEIDGSEIDGVAEIAALNISGKYASLIGESRDGVLIKTHISAEQESLKSALLAIKGEYHYIQDVTIQNYADYNATSTAERANAIRDVGNFSMMNNVYLKGTQDVYLTYRNKDNVTQKIYYKDGKIEGTVDFICGAGDVFFDGVNLYCANSAGSGKTKDDYICAPATYDYENYGYTFNKCVINGESSQAETYYLVRTWQNDPKATYIDVDYSALAPNPALYKAMNAQTTTEKCHSYASTDAEAANYTMEKVLGEDFAAIAKAATAQLEAPAANYADGNVTWTPANNGATDYLIEKNGEFAGITTGNNFAITIDAEKDNLTIRAANGRGGFGEAKQVEGTASGIHAVKAAIERGEKVIFNLAGQRVDAAYKGLVIKNGVKIIQK